MSRLWKAFHLSGFPVFLSSQSIVPGSVPFTNGGILFSSQNTAGTEQLGGWASGVGEQRGAEG